MAAHATAPESSAVPGIVIHVAQNGRESNTGTVNRPVATLSRAITLANAARASNSAAPIEIVVRQGLYRVAEPIVIGPELSGTAARPFVIRGAPGQARPILSATRPITGAWREVSPGRWEISAAGAPFDLLLMDGKRLVRARYPNFDPAILPLQGFASSTEIAARAATWRDPAGGVLHALHVGRWGDFHVPILGKGVDGALSMGEPVGNNRRLGLNPEFQYVENIAEELDAPNEWYLDRARNVLRVVLPPGVTPAASRFEASTSESLFRVIGTGEQPVRHVRIEGFEMVGAAPTFLLTTEPLLRSDWLIHRSGAVLVAGAEDVTVTGNLIHEIGGNAIFVSGYARRIAIRTNEIHDIGAGAINFVGLSSAVREPNFEYNEPWRTGARDLTPGPKTEDYPADSIAEDNLIHDIGSVEKQVAGVQIAMARGIIVRHNSIYNVPRSGINIGDGTWGGHLLEWNDVFNTVLETGDHGAFNSWGRDRFWNPDRELMNTSNLADPSLSRLDAIELITIRFNRFHCEHGWDIDLDDGSSNYLIESNLMLAGGLKLREGFDRTVRNNIMINNSFHPHVWFRHSNDRFERNVLMGRYQPILIPDWGDGVDFNLFPNEPSLRAARANGTDANSAAGDPMFVNAAAGDFTVPANSPASRIGFVSFPMDRFGVTNPELRARAQTAPIPVLSTALSGPGNDAEIAFNGARVKSVTTLGEQSAAGLTRRSGVLVLAVSPDTNAGRAGLRAGDVIIATRDMDHPGPDQSISDISELVVTYQSLLWRGSINFVVMRNQRPTVINMRTH